ncbi:unnamed protein product, partial [Polarella glacialis]
MTSLNCAGAALHSVASLVPCRMLQFQEPASESASFFDDFDDFDFEVEFRYLVVEVADKSEPRLVRWEGEFANRRESNPRGQGVERLFLQHRFGEAAATSSALPVEQSSSAQEPSAAVERADSKHPGPFQLLNLLGQAHSWSTCAQSGGATPSSAPAPASSSVLAGLEVEPSVRLTRLVVNLGDSSAFTAKYQLEPKVVLGTGMSGGVVLAVVKETGAHVAVKTITIELDEEDPTKLEQTKAEVQNQLLMDHPNICRLLEVYEEPGRLLMVMEKLNGPDLYEHLSNKGRYTERDAKDCVRQICSAVAYCHRNGVCHRDLKLENFCLEDKSDNARIKMIDFGLSEAIGSLPMTDSCGTLYYVAPEVLKGRYNEKCDAWSLGVLAYILLDGRAPFMGRDDRATYKLIKSGVLNFPSNRWDNISKEARDFVTCLLQVNPSNRLSAEKALQHPWLATSVGE